MGDSDQQQQTPLAAGQRIAQLPTVSYRALAKDDPTEVAKLLSVCVEEGFFYLDMRDDNALLGELDTIYGCMETWFGQPDDVKRKLAQGSHIEGYDSFCDMN